MVHLKRDAIIGGVMGVIIGDALGLPVQFMTKTEIKKNPITDMTGGGVFGLEPGAWSDDSSLTLCLAESLYDVGYNPADIARRFVMWYRDGYLTPSGKSFDVGGTTEIAMKRLIHGVAPFKAGPTDAKSNGNGSLMRILPATLFFAHESDYTLIQRICEVSKITHGHPRSQLACSLYSLFVRELLKGSTPQKAYDTMLLKSQTVFFIDRKIGKQLSHFKRIISGELPDLDERDIKSGGYVVESLEAALWSFLTTSSFEDAVLKAVNLGWDTDTVGAITGSMAGVHYGYSNIPDHWLRKLLDYEKIMSLTNQFAERVLQTK
ncbi:ADP-ribosylglycohydrolase family protein [Desulfosporosinus sp. SRJS8]|nr:ADP-ribosylglycohydrolase family protein [Desulfosporosinus sp. SRJS8]MCB8814546.1 ADP-ribosylglycohydrolase family protein [Desulfosporosinus sp. SRJS8]